MPGSCTNPTPIIPEATPRTAFASFRKDKGRLARVSSIFPLRAQANRPGGRRSKSVFEADIGGVALDLAALLGGDTG